MTYNTSKPYTGRVLELIKTTWTSPYLEVADYGDHPVLFLKTAFGQTSGQVDHTDGIGTKAYYHYEARSWEAAALDALAMNLNDLLAYRAQPFKLQSHITLPWDDEEDIIQIVEALVKQCKDRSIVFTGGETSINNMNDCPDVSITMSGFVMVYAVNQFLEGDALIGLPSTGLHANGFTLLRQINSLDPFLAKGEWPDDFIMPTAIYWDAVFPIAGKVNGIMHITGGAFTKFKPFLKNTDIYIGRQHQLQPQQIFRDIHAKGIPDEEMYRTFNCGIGLVLSVNQENVPAVLEHLPTARLIGGVHPGQGRVHVLSAFSDKELEV
jgi:phosphoribosylformylglycinamidine cyclo-ligase